jgi:D-glycero-D-manno-heptose 1,7-bisphosphate phosphatase
MQKALFLDRDGVINCMVKKFGKFEKKMIDDSPFNMREFKFNESILDLVKSAKSKGYKIIVVTNQPSILKGETPMQDYEEMATKICDYLQIERADILECFHKEGLSLPCLCRKPKPGLILMASGLFNIDIKSSILIGDSWKDIVAAQTAGIRKTLFIKRLPSQSQIGNAEDEQKMTEEKVQPTKIIDNLHEAIDFL